MENLLKFEGIIKKADYEITHRGIKENYNTYMHNLHSEMIL